MLLSSSTLRKCGVKHALMREVAHLEWGNFRGVCPIFKPGERTLEGIEGYLRAHGATAMRVAVPELSVTPAMPVLYCAEKKNTARCKFCPPTNQGGENSHGSERKNPYSY